MESNYVFLDVDGTLVNYSNELPNSTVKAIKTAQANGHKVYPVTGRSKAEMYAELLEIGFDRYIGGNGNYVESNDEVILHQLITAEQEKMIFDGQLYRADVNKISFILEEYEDYLAAADFFSDFQVGTWGGIGEQALFGDIALANITKQTAIKKLLEHHGVDRKNTIAFGDAKVDIPMLEYCEIGVAMGNGGKEITAMADHITDSVDNDGLEKAFLHLGLIE